jgi:hypothetical protein
MTSPQGVMATASGIFLAIMVWGGAKLDVGRMRDARPAALLPWNWRSAIPVNRAA